MVAYLRIKNGGKESRFDLIGEDNLAETLKTNNYKLVYSQLTPLTIVDYRTGKDVKKAYIKFVNGDNWVADTKTEITWLKGLGIEIHKGEEYF